METLLSTVRAPSRAPFLVVWSFLIAANAAFAQSRLSVTLPAPAQGPAAISALGTQLPAVARAYGLSPQHLTSLLQAQPSLGVDRDGVLLFTCNVPPNLPQLGSTSNAGGRSTNTVSNSSSTATGDPLHLHSFPGAPLVIYLDFNGHTTTGTQWNSSFTNSATIVSEPFDLDGSPSTFNAAELTFIQHVWQRVAEDYAGFAVDVTTEDPGVEALRKASPNDANYGVRVVISPTNWYNTSAGGVAYIGSFNWDSDTPCFIFTLQLANGEKYIAEAAAHEVGHTLGLYHDGVSGTSASEYYFGHGDWAPIMGVSYYRPITQFSRGEYANANNTQDDFATIATFIPYASDDHGNTLATASVLNGPTVSDGGTIERNTDVDVFRFTTGAGPISLTIQGTAPEPDLDIKAELLGNDGQVLQTADPAGLSASLSATLAAGTYYLRISGVGIGDPSTGGYSNYGSVGNYVITGTLATTNAPQPPVAVAGASVTSGPAPLTVTFSSAGSNDPDGTIVSYSWNFGNGASSTAANPVFTYNAAGTFTATLTVTDNSGLTNSASIAINVSAGGNVAPTITTQPTSRTVAAGSTVSFTVAATGSPTPTFTWYRNGVTFPGWTNSTLVIEGVTANDVGTYMAVATNSAGSVNSAPATLDVGSSTSSSVAPTITTQPTSQTVTPGTTVTFNGAASGSPTPTYQWYKNGAALSGATSASLVLNSVIAADAGNYTFVATNTAGSATSNIAVLTVNTSTGDVAPAFTTQPVSQTAATGSTVTFSVVATGSPTPIVTWYRNGVTFSGWTGSSVTLVGVTSNDIGTYTAVATNSAGSVTSQPATLNVQ